MQHAAAKSNTPVAHSARVQQYFALTLLQQHVDAADNACLRDLTANEAKQLERICNALLQLQKQQTVTAAKLRSALTADQYTDYLQQRQAPTSIVNVSDKKSRPYELTGYLDLLKVADLTDARADRARFSRNPKRIGNSSAAEHWRNKSADQYEQACEYLEETLGASGNQRELEIRAWLDRDFDMSTAGTTSIDCEGVARVIGSRSKYCQLTTTSANVEKKKHWAQCTQDALQQSARALLYAPVAVDTAQTKQLQSLMSRLKTLKH